MIVSDEKDKVNNTIQRLIDTYTDITIKRGKIHEYLGMKFDFSNPGEVFISMSKYTKEVVAESGVIGIADTPAAADLFEIDKLSNSLNNKEREVFHRTVAQCLYAVTRTRSDASLPVIFLTTRVLNPTEQDRRKLDRVLRYFNGSHELDELGGTSVTSDELGGTDGESTDIARYRTISKRYHRGCPHKYFAYVGRKFNDIADNLTFCIVGLAYNLTFCIVGLAYNPDFKAKYFLKYFDTALNSTPPTDDDLFEYTPITEILSDSDNVFLPPDTPHVCPGPSAPARMNLVTVGFVDPNMKSNSWLPGPPRSRISRAEYFQGKKTIIKFDQDNQKISNTWWPFHIQASPQTSQTR